MCTGALFLGVIHECEGWCMNLYHDSPITHPCRDLLFWWSAAPWHLLSPLLPCCLFHGRIKLLYSFWLSANLQCANCFSLSFPLFFLFLQLSYSLSDALHILAHLLPLQITAHSLLLSDNRTAIFNTVFVRGLQGNVGKFLIAAAGAELQDSLALTVAMKLSAVGGTNISLSPLVWAESPLGNRALNHIRKSRKSVNPET